MRSQVQVWVLGAAVAALAIGGYIVGPGSAAEADDLRGTVLKVAAALEKKDDVGAKKLSSGLKEAELSDLMAVFKVRRGDKGGFGFGNKAGEFKPDGIESKLTALARTPLGAKALAAEADALTQAGLRTAAIAEVIHGKSPVSKKEGKKDPKEWQGWSADMKKGGLDLAEAAKAKDAAKIKTAAGKINASCSNCHDVFRD